MALKQKSRLLSLSTPLGEDKLVLTSFSGQEELSRLFRFQLDMIADQSDIQPAKIVGKEVGFSVELLGGDKRPFHGIVSQFVAGDEERGRRNYRAEVVPWLWFLTKTADCRIFQQMSIPDIIEKIFTEYGFTKYKLDLKGNHPKWEYCVQYRETDFHFVSRLMEQEGIFYFFQHEAQSHTMLIADHAGAYVDCVEKEVIYPTTEGRVQIADHLTSWEHRYEFRSGKFTQTDYNFKTPEKNLSTDSQTVVDLPDAKKYEIYDYPGAYETVDDGRDDTKVRMEEEEAGYDVVHATSHCKSFTPGGKFKVKEHRSKSEQGKSFVVTAIHHHGVEPAQYETGQPGSTADYSNSFTAIPEKVVFRPPRITPKPVVSGVQTAVVVGPAGEEIYTDEYGRVKVQFHWDREGKKDDKSSCWIRVAQNWAGQNWGIVFNPRIGQEVIVDFLEGDPDRPIITGRVYNADQMPPYPLPDEQTKSTIKTRSSKGGGEANFNEICFEDLKGEERLFIHAEKNQDIEVENDETHWVGHDRTKTIDHDETTHVKHNRTETVDNDETIGIHGNRSETVDKDETITIHANRTETVDKNESLTVLANRTRTVAKDESITINGARSEQVAKDESITVGASRTHNVGKNDSLAVANNLTINAGDQISLTTGKASIIMKKDGTIVISGKDITITGSGQINAKASKNIVLKGKKILQN
jgi:type VI secretion system secreted protein VgrG